MHNHLTRRPRIAVLISSGWAVRNYLRSEFLGFLSSRADVIVVMPRDEALETQLQNLDVHVCILLEQVYPHYFTGLNGLLAIAHNRRLGFWNPLLWKWMVGLDSWAKKPYLFIQRFVSRVFAYSPLYQLLCGANDRLLDRIFPGSGYDDFFRQHDPDVVFCSNPYSFQELAACYQAKRKGIKTVAAIVSWDNLSYKGRLPIEHDYYVVWSRTMKKELEMHKPGIMAERVTITGTPQFDFHLQEDLYWSREGFFARIGGDPKKRLMTYGGSVASLFPDETEFVLRLWRATQDGSISDKPQLLVRLHPHDNTSRFEEVKRRCPGLMLVRPWMSDHQRFWFTPSLEELALLTNTIRYSDVGLNTCSSLSLDFALLDKPVVNVAFPGIDGNPKSNYVRECYKSYHYRQVVASGGVRIAQSFDEMIREVNEYLEDPGRDRALRARLVNEICGPVDGEAHKRIAAVVLHAIGNTAVNHRSVSCAE